MTTEPTAQDLLSSIIKESTPAPVDGSIVTPTPEVIAVKKRRDPMTPKDFVRVIGAVSLTAIIAFSIFLAYVVFNPAQAQIFVQLGVNPADLAALLNRLVFYAFLTLTSVESIVFMIVLFQAIITKKEFKRKKTIYTISSGFVLVIAFATMSFWAFLTQQIGAADFANPNGGVIISDNDWRGTEGLAEYATLTSFENIIGPVALKFDLKSDVIFQSKTFDIRGYEFDCGNGTAKLSGNNPSIAEIICRYDTVGTYQPVGSYIGRDRTIAGAPNGTREIKIPSLTVNGAITKETRIRRNREITTFDGESLSQIAPAGRITWSLIGKDVESQDKSFTVIAEESEQLVCLNVFAEAGQCDRYFVVAASGQSTSDNTGGGEIIVERDPDNERALIFTLSGVNIDEKDEIVNALWKIDDSNTCAINPDIPTICRYTFLANDNAQHSVSFAGRTIISPQKSFNLSKTFVLYAPIAFSKDPESRANIKVTDKKTEESVAMMINSRETVIPNIKSPTTLIFDVRDIKVTDASYALSSVEWDFDGEETPDRLGPLVEYEFSQPKRYEVIVKYSFTSERKNDTQSLTQRFIVNAEKPDIQPVLNIARDGDYAPVIVKFDASESEARDGKIVKFSWDFGDGIGAIAQGDAIQNRRYDIPGSYTVKLTVTREDGKSAMIEKNLEIKPAAFLVVITPSVARGKVGQSVDFSSLQSNGQIVSYEWDFGDGNKSYDPNPTHTYQVAGTYSIKLTVTYDDKRLNSQTREFTVVE